LRRGVAAGAALCALLVASPAAARVVLFGIDGGSWPLIDRALAAGELPAFAALRARGVTAELATVEPVISPTVWSSIATGRSPEAHGITDFMRNRTHLRVPTVFERMAARGLRVGLYDYLVTWPPRTLPHGFVIPGWLRRDERMTPSDVFARAGVSPYFYAVERFRSREKWAANARRELGEKPERWNRLADAFALDVGAVSFYALDAIGHRFWRAAFPEEFDEPPTPAEAAYRDTLHDTLLGMDAALGRVVAALGPGDSIVVVSDHGFEAADGARRVWSSRLEEQLPASALAAHRDAIHIEGEFIAAIARVDPGPFEKREPVLRALAAWLESAETATGEPAFTVDVIDVVERPAIAERPLAERAWQWLLRQVLLRRFGLKLDRPAFAYVLARPDDEALLAAWPDGMLRFDGRRVRADELFQLDEFSGAHDPTGIFLAAGPPFSAQRARDRVSVLEVAPLLLHLAGLPVPDDLESAVPERLLAPAWRAAHPVRRVPATELPGLPDEPADAAVDDAVLLERLRALGYVE
jgi:Type I phosphodiesterase / nucleotide pyrophosphatase